MSGDDVASEAVEPVDPLEEQWLLQQPELVERLARERLAKEPGDLAAQAWLGLAQCVTNQVPAGQAALLRVFEQRRAQVPAGDAEARDLLAWELHGLANHLLDYLQENPTLGVPAARFVVDKLGLEHPPSLRLLAEDVADREGDALRGAALLQRALALDPSDPETHYLAARLYARVGRKPQALQHLGQALEHAAGLVAVRLLARYEPDFDGLRKDAAFAGLVDLFPSDATLRPLYQALDAREVAKVLELAPAALAGAAQKLDVLYPWREALELSVDQPGPEQAARRAALAEVEAQVEALEAAGGESALYARFCGDA